MEAAQDSDAGWKSASGLEDSESDWNSAGEEMYVKEALLRYQATKDVMNGDGNDMAINQGTSSRAKSKKKRKRTKKAPVDVMNSGANDMAINQGTSSCATPKKRRRRTKIAPVDVMNSDGNGMDITGSCATYELRPRKPKKASVNPKSKIDGDHWSREEKSLLLVSMQHYGMLNEEHLAAILGTKSVQQVEDFILRVSKAVRNALKKEAKTRAARSMSKMKAPRKKAEAEKILKQLLADEMGDGPIDWWISYIEKITAKMSRLKCDDPALDPSMISELIPITFQLISQYEDHPEPSSCSGVDYKEAYQCLYHVLSGAPPTVISQPTAVFIERSIDRLRSSLIDGMYAPNYRSTFEAQVNLIYNTSKDTRPVPKRTYGAPTKKVPKLSVPAMTYGSELLSPSQSFARLMNVNNFNPMKVPKTLTCRKCYVPTVDKEDKDVPKQKRLISNDIGLPFGIFSDVCMFEG